MIILKVLGYCLLFLSTLILLMIIIPIKYNIEGSKYDDVNLLCRISLYAGILQMKLNIQNLQYIKVIIRILGYPLSREINLKGLRNKDSVDMDVNIEAYNNKAEKKAESNYKIKNYRKKDNFFSFINKDTIFECFKLLKKTWNSIKPNLLYVKLDYGFDDPYYTAMICAYLSAFDSLLKEYTVNITSTFSEPKLEGEFKIKGRIAIITLLYILIRFMVSYPIRSIIKKIIRKKKEEKRYAI